MKKRYRFLIGLVLLLGVLFAGFSMWALTPPEYGVMAQKALKEEIEYTVEERPDYLDFNPMTQTEKGVIFYPGGRVSPYSYAPLAGFLAESGYRVIILKVPFNMAIFSPAKAEKVMKDYPELDIIALAGHSLGGATASIYWETSTIPGLCLLSAYPTEKLNRSEPVLALYGSKDGLLSIEDRQSINQRLPKSSIIQIIEGGNHAQMGDYGSQKGDMEADISLMDQQNQVMKSMLSYLEKL